MFNKTPMLIWEPGRFIKNSRGQDVGFMTEVISHKVAAGLIGKPSGAAFRMWAVRHNRNTPNKEYHIRRAAPGLVYLADVWQYATVAGAEDFLSSRPRRALTLQDFPTVQQAVQNYPEKETK